MKKALSLILVLVILSAMLVSCSARLEGRWKTTEDIITKELVLSEGNVGTFKRLGIEQDIIWKIENGKLTVTASVLGVSTDIYKNADYSISGDELTITESDGEVTVYTRIAD